MWKLYSLYFPLELRNIASRKKEVVKMHCAYTIVHGIVLIGYSINKRYFSIIKNLYYFVKLISK